MRAPTVAFLLTLLATLPHCGGGGGGADGGPDTTGGATSDGGDATFSSEVDVGAPFGDVGNDAAGDVGAAFPFPAEFRLGASTAAHQVEGGQTNNWSQWETLPQFAGRTAEPSGVGVDHYHRYEEDLDLVLWMGLDTFRLSIEWSRIEPARGRYDADEIAHYRDVFRAMADRGIRPSVTLHHFTDPTWFVDLTVLQDPINDHFCPNGPSDTDFCFWTNPDAPGVFGDFCGLVAAEYGALVDEWMTFNELFAHWITSSVGGDFPPGLSASTEEEIRERALPVLRGILAAHVACYHAIHAADTVDADGDGVAARVGATTGTGAIRPADPEKEADREAARQGEYLASFLVFDALTSGLLDADFDTVPEEPHEGWRDTLDILGVQYYASTVVVGMALFPPLWGVPCVDTGDDFLAELALRAGCPPPPSTDFPMGDSPDSRLWGRQNDPEGLREVLDALHARYPTLPMVITENGYANDDTRRAASLVRHLAVCQEAVADGLPLEGYYHWSLLDNFEWALGYAVRYGLFRVDRTRDLARTPTIAAEVYREVAAHRGLTDALLERWGGTGPLPRE